MQDQPQSVELPAECYIVTSCSSIITVQKDSSGNTTFLSFKVDNFASKRPERGKLFPILIVNQSIFAIVNTTT